MKVAVVEFAGKGGLMHYTFQLCRALSEAGAEVALVTDGSFELDGLPRSFRVERVLRLWDPKPEREASSAAARLLRRPRRALRALRYWREWFRLIGWLRRERPDVVQFGDIRFAADLPFFWLLRLCGLRLAEVCHNVHPFRSRGPSVSGSSLTRFLYRRIYRLFERVFVHFERNREAFLAAFGIRPDRVVSIPHGNQEIFREMRSSGRSPDALRAELDLAAEDRVVLFFGTLSRHKGTDLLLEAWPGVLAAHPRAVLVLAGFPLPGFDLEAHRESARRLGVADRVRFAAAYLPSGEVAAWMELADVVAFPYRTIFQSGALHVAQTFGRPIVATEVGAFPEVIVPGRTGILVPPDEPGALRDAVALLLDRPGMARRLGRNAAWDASVRFSWTRPAGTILREYGRLLGAGGPAPPRGGEGEP